MMPATRTGSSTWAQQCPLCGQSNGCAVAQGLPAAQCWCMSAEIDPQALERLAPAERGQRCICPACGRAQPDPGARPNRGD
ncbi:cysteine-rich CWC family protein [Comamonas sp. JNW]|nr:cysteine-rich CWC family protein [Comamonas sp. JNW]